MLGNLLASVTDVSRAFGQVQALTRASIDVPEGKITVLLGPNGAGKTTAIRIITGALGASEGMVSVFGLDPAGEHGATVRARCGVVSAKPSLYDRLSGWDNLRYAAELYDLGRGAVADSRIREAAATFDIEDSLDLAVGGYSTGMKTRLALARAILHEPDLLLLDEPTSGLDPESAASVLELIENMSNDGRTVLMCTHLLMEAEGLADHVVMMEQGTTLLAGAPSELARRYWPRDIVRIRTRQGQSLEVLRDCTGVLSYDLVGNTGHLELDTIDRVPALIRRLAGTGAEIVGVAPFNPTLEDIYFAARGHNRFEPRETPVTRSSPVLAGQRP